MGLLHGADAWLSKTLARAAGVDVVYSRGDLRRTICGAVPASGEPIEMRPVSGKARESSDLRDWLIPACELVLGFGPVVPAEGDTIEAGAAGRWAVAPRNSEPAWSWTDPHRATYRVRCVRLPDAE